MSIVVTTLQTVDWNLTREEVAARALRKCRVLGAAEQPDPDDLALALESLDAILKNLQWYGYSWPKRVSGSQSLSYVTPNASMALPLDYYGQPMLTYVNASSQEIGLYQATPEEWKSIVLKTQQADYPDRYYIDNFNKLWLYPVPNQNLTLQLYYEKVIDDTVTNTPVFLDSPWILGLTYGVSADIGDDFNVSEAKLTRFELKWREQRTLGIQNESFPGPDRMTVSD